MSNQPLVSVVIATYNTSKYLPFAIRSVLSQSYDNIELMIVDDGSTDDTGKVVEPFLDDSRVRYIVQKNQGQASAKNRGINEANGEYIAFLDADDMWFERKLERQLPIFGQSKSIGVVYARLLGIDESGKPLTGFADQYPLRRGRITRPLFIYNFIRFGTAVARRECFSLLGSFRPKFRMGIDYDLWLRFSTQFEFDYIDEPLLYYRVWEGQLSKNLRQRYLNAFEIMTDFVQSFPGSVDAETMREAWANTYVNLGDAYRLGDKALLPALKSYFRALSYKQSFVPAWKSIFKTMLRF